MKNRWFYSPVRQAPAIEFKTFVFCSTLVLCVIVTATRAVASDAPQWMHALANAPLPAHDQETNAVLLYSQTDVTVLSADKIKTQVREAYKILRPEGREIGTLHVYYDSHKKVTHLRAWCIPANGKDFAVNEKDAVDQQRLAGMELYDDLKRKLLQIPAPDPQNIIGYEWETEEEPLVLQDVWSFQEISPVRESHYSLQLPAGWEYKAAFVNHSDVKETQTGSNQWQWTITDIKGIRREEDMPSFGAVGGRMVVSFSAPGIEHAKRFSSWQEMGTWYLNLETGRSDPSPDIRQKVEQLTAASGSTLDKMNAIARYVQDNIRYVAIELGIGGWQPHPARDVFVNSYGDCKDKATLTRAMLQEIGVSSYPVVINTVRGSVAPETPAHLGVFNHQIVAIQLPHDVNSSSLIATIQHPRLGRILFFDPTNELVPFGQIGGYLQANYGLLVGPDGGELIELPKQPSAMNSIRRSAKLTLDSDGNLQGEVAEVRLGDRAWSERSRLHNVANDKDRIKPIETLLAGSLPNYVITKAIIENLTQTSQPFGFKYSFVTRSYAKNAGDMLLVRPRVLGVKARGLLETKEPRQFPIEFEGPVKDTDSFEITLPTGYVVDDLPPPVDADFSFASYHSKTEAKGSVIAYTRTFEVKELSVPVSKADELKKFYRIIAGDERNTAVLKAAR